jgi:hypothetical protein
MPGLDPGIHAYTGGAGEGGAGKRPALIGIWPVAPRRGVLGAIRGGLVSPQEDGKITPYGRLKAILRLDGMS